MPCSVGGAPTSGQCRVTGLPPNRAASNRDRRLDRGMRLVALEREVLVAELGELADLTVETHAREGTRGARKLLARLVQVVEVEVRVAQRAHELGGREAGRSGERRGGEEGRSR